MTTATGGATEVEMAIGGMTCSSCAARIEKKLNRMDGVEATVNYATEKAKVAFFGEVTVVLDKTGTVTTGKMTLLDVHVADGQEKNEVLWLAGALEDASEHPIAQAVATGAAERVGTRPVPKDFANIPGLGVQGVVDGRAVLVGREKLLGDWAMALPSGLVAAESKGRTAIAVAWDGEARAVLEVADVVKPTSAEAIRRLRYLGLTPVLLTGGNEAVAQAVAAEVGIGQVIAEVMADVVKKLQEKGRLAVMVGGGVNDAAALAQADLGLAMDTGTDAAIEAGNLTLARGDLRVAADAIRISRCTLATIRATSSGPSATTSPPWPSRPCSSSGTR